MPKKETYFQKSWLDQEEYKDWLAEAPEDTSDKCKLCKKVFELSSKIADVLKSHADSERHKQEINLQVIKSFFDKPCMESSSTASAKSNSAEETSQPSLSESSSASGSAMASSIGDKSTTSSSANKVLSQSTIDTRILSSATKAEIILILLSM